jgi:hypothetical protein
VVDEERCDAERAELKRSPVAEGARWYRTKASAAEDLRYAQDPAGCLTHEEWHGAGHLCCQAVVVLVGVRNDDAEQGRVLAVQSGDRGQGNLCAAGGVERPSQVEHDAVTVALNLDAVSADFVGSSPDSYPHRLAWSAYRPR